MTGYEWGTIVCRRLHARISAEVPPEVWGWERAQRMVEAPTAAFCDEIREVGQGRGDRKRAVQLGNEVREAWAVAVGEWRRANVKAA